LPTAFKHTRGVVVVNSTVGLSALMADVPVKVCGRAMYDIPDIAYQGLLSDFWADAPNYRPNKQALQGYYTYLLQRTQLNGSLYKRLSGTASHSGVIWDSPAYVSVLEGRTERMRPREFQQLVAKGQVAA
jgi:capsular polysaccharide export protein